MQVVRCQLTAKSKQNESFRTNELQKQQKALREAEKCNNHTMTLRFFPCFEPKSTNFMPFPLSCAAFVNMEKSSELVEFPLILRSNYRACTIPYRVPSDDPRKPTPTELSWIDLLLSTIPSFKSVSSSSSRLSFVFFFSLKFIYFVCSLQFLFISLGLW